MSKQEQVEVEVEVTEEQGKIQSASETVSKAINNLMDTLETALAGRGNAVMVRVNDDALAKLDMLVASGICNSRSESAAFLLQQGIESSEALFARIADVTTQISEMRQDLQEWVQKAK